MHRQFFVATLIFSVVGCVGIGGEPPPPNSIDRSELFEFSAGDRLEDSDLLIMTGGAFARTEAFEVVRKADGGSVLTSITVGANDSYRVQMRIRYDANEQSVSASGLGNYGGEPIDLTITKADGTARIIATGAEFRADQTTPCNSCQLDMSPSATPMFVMTRLYDEAQGGKQDFRWVARALTGDLVLLDGQARIIKLGDFTFSKDGEQVPVKQYAFVEKLRNEKVGAYFYVTFNLYTTADGRPLGFVTGGETRGERRGYEGLIAALPPQMPATEDYWLKGK